VARLLERDATLKQLRSLLRHIGSRGGGRIVLVRGEAGVGKTALITRFLAAEFEASVRVLQG